MGKATSGNAKGDSGPQENHISKSHVENSTPSAGWRWLPIDYFGCLIDKRQLQTAESQGDVDFPGVEKGGRRAAVLPRHCESERSAPP
jgi:hypothetical protein